MKNSFVPQGRLGRNRWNAIQDAALERVVEYRKQIVEQLMIDGTPPLTQPLSPYMQYLKLQSMALSASPDYTREAALQLAQLSQRFGNPQPFQKPFGQTVANEPQIQGRLAGQEEAAMGKAPIQIFPGGAPPLRSA